MMQQKPAFTLEEIITDIETWLVTGKLNQAILAPEFIFSSPYWQRANKAEFIAQFAHSTIYQSTSLAKITHFDPIIHLKSEDSEHFAIVLQYHTRNHSHVYETVFGKVSQGMLVELRSIYDLNETKKALEL